MLKCSFIRIDLSFYSLHPSSERAVVFFDLYITEEFPHKRILVKIIFLELKYFYRQKEFAQHWTKNK